MISQHKISNSGLSPSRLTEASIVLKKSASDSYVVIKLRPMPERKSENEQVLHNMANARSAQLIYRSGPQTKAHRGERRMITLEDLGETVSVQGA